MLFRTTVLVLGISQYLQKEALYSRFDIFFNTAARPPALQVAVLGQSWKNAQRRVKTSEEPDSSLESCNILPLNSSGRSSSSCPSLPSCRCSGKPPCVASSRSLPHCDDGPHISHLHRVWRNLLGNIALLSVVHHLCLASVRCLLALQSGMLVPNATLWLKNETGWYLLYNIHP